MIAVIVRDNNVEKAIRTFKRSVQRNGILKEIRNRRGYFKPSEKRQKKASESTRRLQKNLRKRLLQEGY